MTEVYLGPAQSGLRAFENKELEMFDVIVDRHFPFPDRDIRAQRIAFANPPHRFLTMNDSSFDS